MRESISASPLCWPPGKPRTPAGDRKQGRFGKRNSSGWGLKELFEHADLVVQARDVLERAGRAHHNQFAGASVSVSILIADIEAETAGRKG